jgi:hypothetical protein
LLTCLSDSTYDQSKGQALYPQSFEDKFGGNFYLYAKEIQKSM